MKLKQTLAATAAMGITSAAFGAAVTNGNLIVLQQGDGTGAALTNAASAVILKEVSATAANTVVQTVALPTTGSGRLTQSGTATSEGALSLNGSYLAVAGYDADVGTAGVASTASSATARKMIGINIGTNLSTVAASALTSSFTSNNIRSAAFNGTNLYAAGATTGIVAQPNGGTGAGTIVSSTITNTRDVQDLNGNLYVSTGSGTNRGIYKISGEPTSTGNTATLLFGNGGSSSPYGFWVNSAETLAYVADDGSAASGGGIQKWVKSGGTWSLAYTISADYDGAGTGNTLVGARGLAVDASGKNALLYFTSADQKALGVITDTGSAAGAFATETVLDSVSGTNAKFAGVVLAVPEPASLAAIGLGGLTLLRRRRR